MVVLRVINFNMKKIILFVSVLLTLSSCGDSEDMVNNKSGQAMIIVAAERKVYNVEGMVYQYKVEDIKYKAFQGYFYYLTQDKFNIGDTLVIVRK